MNRTPPTERQVLYALVALGFHLVTAVLWVGATAVGLSPRWWTVAFGVVWCAAAIWGVTAWRRTGPVLGVTVLVLLGWVVGTLLTR